jgi:hypothetical protein
MKRIVLISLVLALVQLAGSVLAADPPVTRIEFRTVSDKIAPDSFGAKPRVIYIAGQIYTRMEEQLDPAQRLQQLIVCTEPDIWMINLFDHTGRHIVDEGPSFVVHQNILNPNAPKLLFALEFGKEVDFFRAQHATSLAEQTIDGQRCEVSEFKHEGYRLVLSVGADTHLPVQLDIAKEGEPPYAIRYVKYETGLPFDAALFKPPAGIKISDVKPKKKK